MHRIFLVFLISFSIMSLLPAHAEGLNFQYHLDWLPSYGWQNNNLQYLEKNTSYLSNDFRGDFKSSYEDTQLVFRPRLLANVDMKAIKDRQTNLFLSEVYLAHQISGETQISVGRQSYQWGPAEFISWSNTIFHFDYNARSFFYKEDGHYLVRGSYSPTKNASWILMSEGLNEHAKTDNEKFIHGQEYQRKILLKSEIIFLKSSDYIGITFSTAERESKNVGLYGNLEVADGISIYTDSKVTTDVTYYDLTKNSGFDTWKLVEKDKDLHPMMLFGARYEGSFDLRIEYIYNSLGLNQSELKTAISSIGPTNLFALFNSAILNHSGRELLGEQYLYTSFRIPNLGDREDLSLYLRHFYSFQDQSNTLAFLAEKELFSSLVGYLEIEKSFGSKSDELSLLASFTGKAGVKWSY